MYREVIKPLFDSCIALILLILLLPFLAVLSLVLVLHFRSSPFFFQRRIGKGEKAFKIWKLKTMADKRFLHGKMLPDETRTTSLGSFLRRSGIDEIPQIVNIIRGEMSFVGPRPLLPEYLPLFSEEIKERHAVKPGITGLAQMNGGNALEWDRRFQLDLEYSKNISLFSDLKILFGTCSFMMRRKTQPSIGAYKR